MKSPSNPHSRKPVPAPEVDIIIPVYNAPDYTQACLESVLRHTPSPHRVIIIDDASTDGRISSIVEQFSESYTGTALVMKNKKNLGFVGTVNKGMQTSKTRDVILLNTDTVVTSGWVEKLTRAAYSGPNIATVTPLTNNGNSICSVPAFGHINEVPDGYTIDSFARLVERVSGHRYPDIPTAVGFCMFIKRTALKDIGFFDEKEFGKGYGEETDFALRAQKHGWRNVLDDTTYIYHKGHGTFDSLDTPVSEREKKGLVVLMKRYPEFIPKWKRFVAENPIESVHRRIYFGMWCRRRRVPETLTPFVITMHAVLRAKRHR